MEDFDKKRSEKDPAKLVDMESVGVNQRNVESVEINKRNVRLVDEVFSADEEVQVHSKTVKIFHVTFLCLYLHFLRLRSSDKEILKFCRPKL